ncbi:MAG TPA: hypothetical protein PK765_04735 [bacterium]|nr:hypothetical protein [bacterium]
MQEGATFASASAGMLETCRRLLARVESDKAPDITSANDHRDFLSHRDSLVANVHTWIDDDAQAVELNSH